MSTTVRPRRCGLCASGQTVQAAIDYLLRRDTVVRKKKVIINLGTMDIVEGHSLINLKYDFEKLVHACEVKGLEPIITTLAPLLCGSKAAERNQVLRAFNQHLYDRFHKEYDIVDIWCRMADSKGHAIHACYQP